MTLVLFLYQFYHQNCSLVSVSILRAETHVLLGKQGVAGTVQAEGGTSSQVAAAAAAAAIPHSSLEDQGRAAPIPCFPFAFLKVCRGRSVSENVGPGTTKCPEEACRCHAPTSSPLI